MGLEKGGSGSGYAIACPHALSSEAGLSAFRRGGNAIDAALAAAASLTVTLPDNCALGGDLIALVRDPTGEILTVNASGTAPTAVDVEDLRARHSHTMPVFGPATVTVPGLLAGWEELWSKRANLSWRSAFEAAIEQAREGIPASRSVAEALERDPVRLGRDPGMHKVFFPSGAPVRAGDAVVQERLAETLETVASEGSRCFYHGGVGREWLRTMRANGSPLSEEDLAGYVPEVTPALSADRLGHRVHTAPPNSQGVLLLMTLRLLEDLDPDLDPLSDQAPLVAGAFRSAMQVRDEYLADPRLVDVPVHDIAEARCKPRQAPIDELRNGRGDTVAIVTADPEGRAVALIQSLFDSFGAGILDERTGIIAHNRGAFFSLDPGSPNVLAPGKRPAHTLTPVMLTEQDALRTVLGTMGGLAQTQILTQILLHLRRGLTPLEAVAAPRWTVGGIEVSASRTPIQAEGRVPATAIDALAAAGWPIVRLTDFDSEVGEAQAILRTPGGSYGAASDPRSEGKAISS